MTTEPNSSRGSPF